MDNSKEEEEKNNKVLSKKEKYLKDVKDGLGKSVKNITNILENINDWDELINLKEESIENVILKRTKTIKNNYSSCT